MEFKALTQRAADIRSQFAALETKLYGRPWTAQEFALAHVANTGDLMKAIMAKGGTRQPPHSNTDTALAYELADSLWSIFTLAAYHNIDLEDSFLRTMAHLEQRVVADLEKRDSAKSKTEKDD